MFIFYPVIMKYILLFFVLFGTFLPVIHAEE